MLVERTFDTGEVTINYAESGADGPLLVLLHGVTSRWQGWLPAIPALLPRWRVVAADLRGHGRSGRSTERQYGVMDHARDVRALIRHLGDAPVAVIGHSLGAMVAIGLAAEAPDAIRTVVLEDPPLGAFTGYPFGMRPEHPRFVATRDLAASELPVEELARLLTPWMAGQDDVAVRSRAASVSRIDPEVLTAIIENRASDAYDLGDRLRRIACPVLLLQGNTELGGALSDPEARWAASLIPDCALVTLPEIGHGIHAGEPLRFNALVTDFLETVPA